MAKSHCWGEPVETGKTRSIKINPVTGSDAMKEAFRKALLRSGQSVKSERGFAIAINSLTEED
jgi:hypothetical protein